METIIGVTGHRFLARAGKVRAGIDRALDRIEAAFPAERITVVTMLAEGADQLVAECALRRAGARLTAVLPVAQPDYLTDFYDRTARRTFLRLLEKADHVIELPPAASRDEAYLAGGRWIVDNCHVLVAVWDGCPAQGTGGTADIVHSARERGLPLAWIHAGNRIPGTSLAVDLGNRQGHVTLERFPGAQQPAEG